MKVLVVGGTGRLGLAATRCLLKGGHDVRVMGRSAERATLPPGSEPFAGDVLETGSFSRALVGVDAVVTGGVERFHSVRNGLDALPEGPGTVAVHDAVRPFVEVETIRRCFAAAEEHGAAIPVVPVKDTIRRVGDRGNEPLDRASLRAVQTPQVFDVVRLKEAYEAEYMPVFTDDASVWEARGGHIELVEGDLHNIKITTPEDLLSAEAFLNLRSTPSGKA